jgi:hypothetical protein
LNEWKNIYIERKRERERERKNDVHKNISYTHSSISDIFFKMENRNCVNIKNIKENYNNKLVV